MNTFTLGACFQHKLHTGPHLLPDLVCNLNFVWRMSKSLCVSHLGVTMLEVTGFTILESFRSTFGMLTANLKPLTTVSQELEVSRFSAFQIDYGVLTANFKSLLAVSLYHIREFQIHVWCVNREPQTVDSGFWVGVRRFEIFSVLDRRSIFTEVLFQKRPTKGRHT